MIHHISIPAQSPNHVARVLAELLGGIVTPFGPYPNSFIAWAGDETGTAIEVFPIGTEMVPDSGPGQARFRHHTHASGFTATHAAVSVPLSEAEVLALAKKEGWRAVRLSRGWNDVIELWIENRVLLEVMTPPMREDFFRAVREWLPQMRPR
ncbi:MAG: hypothetical protein RLZZ399_2318 [Verrucomicrobiota bacterium]|jgi:hypothetical protein